MYKSEKNMKTAKVSDYRKSLAKFHKSILMDNEPLFLPNKNGSVVVLSAQDYENLLETIYILSDKITTQNLIKIREQVAENKFSGVSVEKAFDDLLESKNL